MTFGLFRGANEASRGLFQRLHVFLRRRAGRFRVRKISELRARLKQGYWAMEDACGQLVPVLLSGFDLVEVLLLASLDTNETLAVVRRHFF